MRPGGGRAKGSVFERQVAKLICTAFGVDSKECYRTPLSGGHLHASKSDPGDLVLSRKLAKVFPYSVECKSYKKLDWMILMAAKKKKGDWSKWWEQAVRAARNQSEGIKPRGKALRTHHGPGNGQEKASYRYPLLVVKGNRTPIFCLYPADGVRHPSLMKLRDGLHTLNRMEVRLNCEHVIVSRFDKFLQLVTGEL